MDVTYSTVPGVGAVHHARTRGGQSFGIVVERSGRRSLVVHGADDGADKDGAGDVRDVAVRTIVLEPDEADLVAEILHSRSLPDRIADVERRLDELAEMVA